MRSGLLTEVIKIYTPAVTINGLGEQNTTYTLVQSCRARVMHRSHNRENMQGDIVYPNSHELQVRIHINIGDYDIILWQGHYYRMIQAPIEDKHNQSKTLIIEQIEGGVTLTPEPTPEPDPENNDNEENNG